MQKKLTIATIFENIQDIHLIKDPGMIPYSLHKYFKYNAIILLSSKENYEYKAKYFKDIETPKIYDTENERYNRIKRLKWLKINAKKIDLLNVFFFDRTTWLYIWIYKKYNKNGLVYVHVDTDGTRLINYKFPKNLLKKIMIRILLSNKNVDSTLWGIQNKANLDKIRGNWPFKNIEYVPDGVLWENSNEELYNKKDDLIITVGRNGTQQKRTDILLNGFANIAQEFPSWKLKIIGTIEKEFEKFLEHYYMQNPDLKNRIEITGPIYDRMELEKEYNRAKIFCLTSDYESFGLVTVEAMSRGCCVIGSNIPATTELVKNGSLGILFEKGNLDDFTEKLKCTLSDKKLISQISEKSVKYVEQNYTWDNIVKKIDKWVREKEEDNAL